ncbi:GHMP family kinase ATP-binding protein [Flagellimonas sp. 2504JD1-5]
MHRDRIVVKAPGRTCLFGDHQDYLGLPVIACAIDRYMILTGEINNSEQLVVNMPDVGHQRIFTVAGENPLPEPGDFLLTALKVLEKYDCVPNRGYNVEITSNIAINAGTSSSSALLLTWAQFLIEAFGCNQEVTKEFLSRVAYEAEVTYHGSPGGKMDQYSIGMGNIIYLETGDEFSYEMFHKPIAGLIVAESGIPKQTTGVLGELKTKARMAIEEVEKQCPDFVLEKTTEDEISKYLKHVPEDLKIYFSAAIINHSITQQALQEFRQPELNTSKIGELMNRHHHILKDYLELTVPKIDSMVDAAIEAGALGAKIVGSGRGGSIVVLAKDGDQEKVVKALMEAGSENAYAVSVDEGVRIIE